MNKICRVVVAGLLLLHLRVVPAAGQEQPLGSLGKGIAGGESLGQLLPLLLKGVGLSPEQGQRVQQIIASHRETLQSLFAQLQAANAALANKLIVPEEVKAEDLAPQVQRITELREQLLLEGLQAVLEVRSVLTPEQRAKAVQLKGQLQALGKTAGGLLGGKSKPTAPEEKSPPPGTR
ncbi:MAG TPA: periplasmic heavy metal sensor [Candidatus Binatia bacterium]|nr:periplasmic heavy metal sensor [Candidatus Binatia bacterium]